MNPFDYDARDRSKKQEVKVEIQKKNLLLKVDCQFTPTDTASSYKRVLGDDAMRVVSKKKTLTNDEMKWRSRGV